MARETTIDDTKALARAAGEFIARPALTWSAQELRDLYGARPPSVWNDPVLVLRDIFRVFWTEALAETRTILASDADSRDRLASVFEYLHKKLTADDDPWGQCILRECRRYDRDKIATCFMIPEVEDFLAELRAFIGQHQEAGVFMPINGDSLLEMLLSIVDGLAFASLINSDFGYSSRITSADVATVTRVLVSGLLVSPLHQSRLYYDAVAQDYDELYTDGVSQAENSIVAKDLSPLCRGKSVLDLGCGSGLGYELLLDGCGANFEYVGVDISSEMIGAARKRWSAVDNARFEVMDAADLSYFGPDSFDTAISLFGSFSHVIERQQAISELSRVLRPGGSVLLMLYSRFSLRNTWLNLRRGRLSHYESMHPYEIRKTSGSIFADAWFYDQRAIRQLFSGFSDLTIIGLNAALELPALGAFFESPRRRSHAQRYLESESHILRRAPMLCHSMIVTARKPDEGNAASHTERAAVVGA